MKQKLKCGQSEQMNATKFIIYLCPLTIVFFLKYQFNVLYILSRALWISRNASDVSLSVTRADNNAVLGKSDEGGYYRTYGSDAEGEKGYLKETYGKGDHGYKTLDTFHKQDGDKYEFQAQTSYGKALDDNKKEQQKEEKNHDHEGAGESIAFFCDISRLRRLRVHTQRRSK